MKTTYYITSRAAGRIEEHSTFTGAIKALDAIVAARVAVTMQDESQPPRTRKEIEREAGLLFHIETVAENHNEHLTPNSDETE